MEAIQACGGQKTADGRRFRTGGGILWSVLKVRDPNAYKEIMRRGKEFEVYYHFVFVFELRNFLCALHILLFLSFLVKYKIVKV